MPNATDIEDLFGAIDRDLLDYMNRHDRMLLVQSLLDGIKNFGKKLLTAEAATLTLTIALSCGGQSFVSSGTGGVANLLNEPRAFNLKLFLQPCSSPSSRHVAHHLVAAG